MTELCCFDAVLSLSNWVWIPRLLQLNFHWFHMSHTVSKLVLETHGLSKHPALCSSVLSIELRHWTHRVWVQRYSTLQWPLKNIFDLMTWPLTNDLELQTSHKTCKVIWNSFSSVPKTCFNMSSSYSMVSHPPPCVSNTASLCVTSISLNICPYQATLIT